MSRIKTLLLPELGEHRPGDSHPAVPTGNEIPAERPQDRPRDEAEAGRKTTGSAADMRRLRRWAIGMPRIRVVRDYRGHCSNPILFEVGDVVTVGKRGTRWPAFVRTITANGNAGWAPADWLRPMGNGFAMASHRFLAKEVNASAGEEGRVVRSYGGWSWIVLDSQAYGWIPDTHFEVSAEASLPEPEPDVESLATCWIRYWSTGGPNTPEASEPFEWAEADLCDLECSDPEKLWAVIVQIFEDPESEPHLDVLAAGPLENLLSAHGAAFIDRVEARARQDPGFARLLDRVCVSMIDNDIVTRMQAVRDRKDRGTAGE